KQRALEKAKGDWVLSIDADEQVTPELRAEIDRALKDYFGTIAFRIPWAVHIFDKRLDFGRSGRAPLRLFKREGAHFSDAQVHEKIILPPGKIGMLQNRLLHFTHRNLLQGLDKFAQYSWLWAQQKQKKGQKTGLANALLHSCWEFFHIYFIRLGFLDGRRGLLMAILFWQYTFNKYAALWSLPYSNDEKK
ncbi:MAG: glycosyltransferase family 2 protein, partial [Desulfobacterales bacterium]